MATTSLPQSTPRSSGVSEVHILWITAGLSCDGDTISITAAEQPSIEDVLLGAHSRLTQSSSAQPGAGHGSRRRLHEVLLSGGKGTSSIRLYWSWKAPYRTSASRSEGYWAGSRDRPQHRPADHNLRMDRPAGVEGMGRDCLRDLRHLWRNSRDGRQPDRRMGLVRLPRQVFRSAAGLPVVNVPGCPVQPDNMMETLLYLLYQAAGLSPIIPLDEQLRPTWLFGKTVHEGCDRAGYYEQGDFAHEYGSPKCLVKIGCWGPVVNCNVTKRGWMRGIGGCPNVGGICIGCTMPGFPDKFMPFMDQPPGALFVGYRRTYGG